MIRVRRFLSFASSFLATAFLIMFMPASRLGFEWRRHGRNIVFERSPKGSTLGVRKLVSRLVVQFGRSYGAQRRVQRGWRYGLYNPGRGLENLIDAIRLGGIARNV